MKEITFSLFVRSMAVDELPEAQSLLVEKAKQACCGSYSPYSRFQVGAAVALANGEIILGSNQENAAYSSGLCAERTALFYAKSRYPEIEIQAIAIAAYTRGAYTEQPVSPCGSCRQVLLEYAQGQSAPIAVLCYGTSQVYRISDARELLPLQFDGSAL